LKIKHVGNYQQKQNPFLSISRARATILRVTDGQGIRGRIQSSDYTNTSRFLETTLHLRSDKATVEKTVTVHVLVWSKRVCQPGSIRLISKHIILRSFCPYSNTCYRVQRKVRALYHPQDGVY
jgi:hypothetical protein